MTKTRLRSGLRLSWILRHLGIGSSRYHRWRARAATGRLSDQWPDPAHLYRLLPEEVEAIVAFALAHPREGYRRLAWMMVDEDVAYVSPSSVYRVLAERDLLTRYQRSEHSGRGYDFKPQAPHQQWHTDIMYVRIQSGWFFFVGVIDAFSRFLVHHEFLISMTTADVTLVVPAALDRTGPGIHPRIVHDRGTQFVSRDWRSFVTEAGLLDIKTAVAHPESNGVLERFHRSLREGIEDIELRHLLHAREVIARWVHYYNHEHSREATGLICGSASPEAV